MKKQRFGWAGLALAGAIMIAFPLIHAGSSVKTVLLQKSKPAPIADAPAAMDNSPGCVAARAAGLVCSESNPEARAAIGQPAIDFQLPDISGVSHRLSDWRTGRQIVVLIWSNPDCPIYSRVARQGTLDMLSEKYLNEPVSFIQIDSSANHGVECVRQGDEKFRFRGIQLVDASGQVGHIYEAKTTPHCFVIDAGGKLVYDGAIDNDPPGLMKFINRTNYVDAALQAVLKNKTPKIQSTRPYGCSVKYAAR